MPSAHMAQDRPVAIAATAAQTDARSAPGEEQRRQLADKKELEALGRVVQKNLKFCEGGR